MWNTRFRNRYSNPHVYLFVVFVSVGVCVWCAWCFLVRSVGGAGRGGWRKRWRYWFFLIPHLSFCSPVLCWDNAWRFSRPCVPSRPRVYLLISLSCVFSLTGINPACIVELPRTSGTGGRSDSVSCVHSETFLVSSFFFGVYTRTYMYVGGKILPLSWCRWWGVLGGVVVNVDSCFVSFLLTRPRKLAYWHQMYINLVPWMY